jgi:hypothetical protein
VLVPLAGLLNTNVDDLSRNLVNGAVALLVGGPHMYVTFTRTAFDHRFASRHKRVLYASLLIPVAVVSLALANLTLLLTLFFFWASIHVLHQIVYVVEMYNHKQPVSLPVRSRIADYAVVLTALYPLAAYRIASGTFAIGANNLSQSIGQVLPLGPWMVWLAGSAFALALVFWLATLVHEYRQGVLFWPKVLFIGLTVTASFFVPMLGNLDTAFQGMNMWHSLQYLALTWMLNNLRQKRGEMDAEPFVQRLSRDGSARTYYRFFIIMTIFNGILGALAFGVIFYIFKAPFNFAFDRSYYIAVLSILLMHYFHDHFLFSRPDVIQPALKA